jgi:uncharacterized SAM-binding protein YcdF (DUF218 family)
MAEKENQGNHAKLRVVEAMQDDAYKGIARIDTETMKEIGVKRGDIVSLPVGRDTRTQTKTYVAEMKKRSIKNVIIATDPYHCQRSITMAEDLDAVATCSPVTAGPNSLENSRYRYLVRESAAFLAYITLGRQGINISDHLNNGAYKVWL